MGYLHTESLRCPQIQENYQQANYRASDTFTLWVYRIPLYEACFFFLLIIIMDKLGFIPLWRKFQNDPLWKERRKFSKAEAWIDILWEVRHDQKPIEIIIKNTVFVCKRGESLYSLGTWANRWNWSISATRRFLDLLKKVKKIDTQSEQQTTRLIVCNYEKYNYIRNVNEQQMKSKRKVNEKQVNTNNKDNNVNNDNNDNIINKIYNSYPTICPIKERPTGKSNKDKVRIKNLLKKHKPEYLMDLIEKYKNSRTWIKNFSTFLNNLPDPAQFKNRLSPLERMRKYQEEKKNDASDTT